MSRCGSRFPVDTNEAPQKARQQRKTNPVSGSEPSHLDSRAIRTWNSPSKILL
jgi:hypothetical protein